MCVYSVGQSNLNLLWGEKVGGYKYDILIVSIKKTRKYFKTLDVF